MLLTTIIQKLLLLVHGGLPTIEVTTTNYRSHIANAQENILQNRIMEEILWNNPGSRFWVAMILGEIKARCRKAFRNKYIKKMVRGNWS